MQKSHKPNIVDLHIHTTKSDGSFSPSETIKQAKEANIDYVSITDHDTIDGLSEAKEMATLQGIKFITGIEISCKYPDGVLHLLGYGFDPENILLNNKLKHFQTARKTRNKKIIEKLIQMDIPVSEAALLKETTDNSSLGRPHIAMHLIKLGVVSDMDEAFQIYLGKKGKAFVDKEIYSAKDTLDMLKQAGGKTVLAHPKTLKLDEKDFEEYLKELVQFGLEGIEAYSSSHNESQIRFYLKMAEKYQLFVTAGSDFHGQAKPSIQLGKSNCGNTVSKEMLAELPLPFC